MSRHCSPFRDRAAFGELPADLYVVPGPLRVSTARQAEHDVSIPDQKRQGEAYCQARGHQLVETYVEPGASATNDRRPEFQCISRRERASPRQSMW